MTFTRIHGDDGELRGFGDPRAEQNELLALTGVETGLLDALMPDGVHTCLGLLLRGQINGKGPEQTWAVVVDEPGLLALLEALNTAATKHFLPKEDQQT